MIMSIEKEFLGARQEQIKKVVENNSRKISDNELRLMEIQDGMIELLQMGREARKIQLEQREFNMDISAVLKELMRNNRAMRSDVDKLKLLSWGGCENDRGVTNWEWCLPY